MAFWKSNKTLPIVKRTGTFAQVIMQSSLHRGVYGISDDDYIPWRWPRGTWFQHRKNKVKGKDEIK